MYVSTRLGRLFYESRGNKIRENDATIVLWHSFLCDGGMWDGQVNALGKLGRVVIFDGPGHGKSEVPPPFSLDDNTRALADALDEMAPGPVVMAGLSWGGMIAMRLALLDPKRIRALVLMDTSANSEPRRNQLKYRAMLSFHRRVGLPWWLTKSQVAPLMFGKKTMRESLDRVHRFHRTTNGFPREGIARAGGAIFGREDISAAISQIDKPTLVVHGQDDRAIVLSKAETIVRQIRGSRLEIIADAGHLATIEEPEAVNHVIVPFIEKNLRA